jgi:hypothetical protein
MKMSRSKGVQLLYPTLKIGEAYSPALSANNTDTLARGARTKRDARSVQEHIRDATRHNSDASTAEELINPLRKPA